jgi:methylated-DNA-protein-cysteine methyltransferase related protein
LSPGQVRPQTALHEGERNVRRPPAAFISQVHRIVAAIPSGRVFTYGRIAGLIPPPAGVDPAGYERIKARWAGQALAACPDDLPWHRVVNAQGRISRHSGDGPDLQRNLLQAEGVILADGAIELGRYLWQPPDEWWEIQGPSS